MRTSGRATSAPRRRARNLAALALGFGLATAASAGPQEHARAGIDDLADLSLEQLAELEITSLSRRPVKLSSAAASLFVITNDDIRRAGVVTLGEALRLAPNLQVARVSAARYAIGARALNNTLTNKLLVLIDGRQIYTPLFSGVFWDQQDLMLEDVERIEVISGPGATIWGANAVNGVINVITRAADASRGGLLAVGSGSEHGVGALRYGGALGADGHYRVYARALRLEDTEDTFGRPLTDGWRNAQVGFRADWGAPTTRYTLQGGFYQGESDDRPAGATEVSGANLLGRWTRQLDGGGELRVRTYVDHVERIDSRNFRDYLDIVDFDFLHYLPRGSHRISWGGGYRNVRDRTASSAQLAFLPLEKVLHVENLFVQDEIALLDSLDLTLGLRAERNVYTGTEYLPNVRLGWRPSDSGLLWTSLARAVRTPARLDREFFAPAQPPFVVAGGPGFESEVANVFELGYRGQPSATASFSVTAFHHDVDKLRSLEPSPAGPVLANGVEGQVQGLEGWASWQPTEWWRLSAGALLLDKDLRRSPGSLDPTGPRAQGNDPEHQWLLRSAFDVGRHQQLDLMLRHVGALPSPAIPSYTALDLRWAWQPHTDLELSLRVQNLLDSSHAEFAASASAAPSAYERAVVFRATWQW